jgi:hypothetical protein
MFGRWPHAAVQGRALGKDFMQIAVKQLHCVSHAINTLIITDPR